jgi:HAD superfamily hydrolase (TIGR01509 family)
LTARRPSRLQPPAPVRAIVFDLDGVLVDTETWWYEVRVEFAAALGKHWTEADRVAMMGLNARQWRARMRERLGVEISEDEIERAISEAMLARYATNGAPAIEGATEAVRRLSGGYALAVASSSSPQLIEAALTGLGVRELIAVTASSDEVGAGKPAPDVFGLAARRLGVDPAECLAVEDSLNGVLAARAAGMSVVLIPNSAMPPAAGAREAATLCLTSLRELDPRELAAT